MSNETNGESERTLQPIQLTPEGDTLEGYPDERHTQDKDSLTSCVGLHMYCKGWMDRHRATENHDALVCRKCSIRVLFPEKVKTYGDLRHALATAMKKLHAEKAETV